MWFIGGSAVRNAWAVFTSPPAARSAATDRDGGRPGGGCGDDQARFAGRAVGPRHEPMRRRDGVATVRWREQQGMIRQAAARAMGCDAPAIRLAAMAGRRRRTRGEQLDAVFTTSAITRLLDLRILRYYSARTDLGHQSAYHWTYLGGQERIRAGAPLRDALGHNAGSTRNIRKCCCCSASYRASLSSIRGLGCTKSHRFP
jgi:hypothetical protein